MNLTNPFSAPTLPGVAGPASSGQPVVYDPSTGLYVNQTTGGVSTDPGGQHPVQNPSLATQAARNISVSNNLMSKLSTYGNQYQQALQGQTGLTQELQRTINGTGPSVAQGQLQQGLGQIRSAANSEAAGATGANAALARQNATLVSGDAATKTNQDAAVLRAQEVAQAEQAKGQVLGSQAGESAGLYGTNLAGANAAAGLAGSEEGTVEGGNQHATEQQNQLEFNLLNGAGQVAAKIATAPGSDPAVKKNIKPLQGGSMDAFMKKLAEMGTAIGFDYKEPGTALGNERGELPGHRVGVDASKVEQGGPIGKSMVIQGKTRKLDLPNAVGAALAAVGFLKREIEEMKKKKAA